MPSAPIRIGLVADTHGLVRPECLKALAGVELILHAGDVGGAHVLEDLGRLAPVHAVAGNTDLPGCGLPAVVHLERGGLAIHVSHGHEVGAPTPLKLASRYGADVLVYGHTHRALAERIGAQLVVNPGAAGPGRFNLVPSVAILTIDLGRADVDIRALV
jgi:hypothetical protein